MSQPQTAARQPKRLSPALLGDKRNLSDQARKEILNLNGARPWVFLWQAFGAWMIIIAATTISIYADSIIISLFAIIIVATRFNIFALLIHEQVHFLGLRGRYGDLITDLLLAYPLGSTVKDYAKVHLSHHKFYFTEKDPDHLRKTGVDWTFPMSSGHLAKLVLSDLLGLSFVKLLQGKHPEKTALFERPHPSPRWLRPAFYVTGTILLTYEQMWGIFLMYWILPLITLIPLIVRLGAISEHIYNSPGASVAESSPLIIQKWWERLILPNLNFTLHPYHHFYPGVAWINLPKVHEIFKREQLVSERNIFYGYGAYFKYLQSAQVTTSLLPGATGHQAPRT
jgi:fatty acid desaturase